MPLPAENSAFSTSSVPLSVVILLLTNRWSWYVVYTLTSGEWWIVCEVRDRGSVWYIWQLQSFISTKVYTEGFSSLYPECIASKTTNKTSSLLLLICFAAMLGSAHPPRLNSINGRDGEDKMTYLPASLDSGKMERLEKVHQRSPCSLLHSSSSPLPQTSQWSLRTLQDTLHGAHGWVEPRLHHCGLSLAVPRCDRGNGRIWAEWAGDFMLNDKRACECLVEIRAEWKQGKYAKIVNLTMSRDFWAEIAMLIVYP